MENIINMLLSLLTSLIEALPNYGFDVGFLIEMYDSLEAMVKK